MPLIKENKLGLSYGWDYGESGWNTAMDANILLLGFTDMKEINSIRSTPPLSSNDGDAYIIGSSATAKWTNRTNQIAVYTKTGWSFIEPRNYFVVYNISDGCEYQYLNGWSLKKTDDVSNYIVVKTYSFLTGYTITNSAQVLLNPSNGHYYQWLGTVPYVIPRNSTPETTGGLGLTAWSNVKDLRLTTLLQETTGATLVNTSSGLDVQTVLDNKADTSIVTTLETNLSADITSVNNDIDALQISVTNLESADNELAKKRMLPNLQTGTTYTLALSDYTDGLIVEMSNAAANTVVIPLNSVVPFPIGATLPITQIGAGQTKVVADVGVTLRNAHATAKIAAQWGSVAIRQRDTDEWVLEGNLAAS